jgi:hypothetical protein
MAGDDIRIGNLKATSIEGAIRAFNVRCFGGVIERIFRSLDECAQVRAQSICVSNAFFERTMLAFPDRDGLRHELSPGCGKR